MSLRAYLERLEAAYALWPDELALLQMLREAERSR